MARGEHAESDTPDSETTDAEHRPPPRDRTEVKSPRERLNGTTDGSGRSGVPVGKTTSAVATTAGKLGGAFERVATLTDALSHPKSVTVLKRGATVAAALGVGTGVAAYVLVGSLGGGDSLGGQVVSAVLGLSVVTGLSLSGCLLAAGLGFWSAGELREVPAGDAYATAAVNGFVGHLLLFFLGTAVVSVSAGSSLTLGNLAFPGVLVAVQAGILGAVAAFTARSDGFETDLGVETASELD